MTKPWHLEIVFGFLSPCLPACFRETFAFLLVEWSMPLLLLLGQESQLRTQTSAVASSHTASMHLIAAKHALETGLRTEIKQKKLLGGLTSSE